MTVTCVNLLLMLTSAALPLRALHTSRPLQFLSQVDIGTINDDTTFARLCSADEHRERFQDDVLQPFLRPRIPGTEGSRIVRQHITSRLTSLGWYVTEDSFEATTPLGARRFTNVVATFDPMSRSQLTLACHYDSKQMDGSSEEFIGATDAAVSCAMLIDLAECLSDRLNTTSSTTKSVQLIFFDGEESVSEWTVDDSLYGSRHLADVMDSTQVDQTDDTSQNKVDRPTQLQTIKLFVLLDLIGTRQTQFVNWFPETSRHFAKLAEIESSLASRGLLQLTEDMTTSLYNGNNVYFRLPSIVFTDGRPEKGIQDDHVPFMNKGVRVLHLISYPFPAVWHTNDDSESAIDYPTVDNLSAILRVFIAGYLGLLA